MAVTRMSSRGQIVIPAEIRRILKLGTGDVLQVEHRPSGEIVLRAHSRDEARRQLEKGYEWFRTTGRDLVEELHEARRQERRRAQGRRP